MANPKHARAKVQRLVEHGPGVFSVWLELELPLARFKVGQFLHLALDPFSPESGYWPESRVFSIASSPEAAFLRIVYSVKGRYTRRMSRELAEGREVWLKYPFGDFIVETRKTEETRVLVAGGTGISPFVGLLNNVEADLHNVWLYYGARDPGLLVFAEELEAAVKAAGLNLELCVERMEDSCPLRPGVRLGTLDIDAIHAKHDADGSAHYYLSGPPGMIESFKASLLASAVALRNVHMDAWE